MDNIKKEIELFGITEGIICQQCNCQGRYGAGLSGVISNKFPIVLEQFKINFSKNIGKQFGTYEIIPIAFNHIEGEIRTLSVANIYSQDRYGNSAKTGVKYTNKHKLISAILEICEKFNCNVYIPHSIDKNGNHTGIGCGLAGEKWENIYPVLQRLNLPNLYLVDTFTGETQKM